jgi:glycosyltransferase involved in cell wall biosynthesis
VAAVAQRRRGVRPWRAPGGAARFGILRTVRVALNLVFLVPGEVGGMEIYARELIPRLAAIEGIEPVCLVNREAAETGGGPWGEACPMEVVPVRARSRVQWVRGEQQYVPRLAARGGCDLVHSLASTAPLWGRVPRVTTIHDINYLVVPEAHFGLRAAGMRVLVPGAARRSRRVIVDAQSTLRDLVERLGVAEEKVDVVPLAAEPRGSDVPTPEPDLRARLGLGDRAVVLAPGAKRPHKNLARVVDALALIEPQRRPLLVASGYVTPYDDGLRARAQSAGVAGDVLLPGWLPEADVEGLYALAALVAYPSLYEGFGLPVLEAMARGVPVVTSGRSSLPEVAGDAALLVDPLRAGEIAAAITRVLDDGALRDRMRAQGLEQAARFSWERTAQLTAASYRRALGQPQR